MLKKVFAARQSERKVAQRLETARACLACRDRLGAQQHLEELLESSPDHPEALYLLGRVMAQAGAYDRSVELLQKAVSLAPDLGGAFGALANVYRLQGRTREALQCYQTAIAHGRDVVTLINLAALLRQLGRDDDALDYLGQALVLQPDSAPAHVHMGAILRKRCELDAAADHFARAAAVAGDPYDALYNLAVTLRESGRYDEAETVARRVLELRADCADALATLGAIQVDGGRVEEGIACLEQAVVDAPTDGRPATHLAQARLLSGDFGRGWDEYEKRWSKRSVVPRKFPYPPWDGSPLTGKTILVYGEQGLGDEIMFSSCLADVTASARHCVVECDKRLVSLLRRSFPGVSVHGRTGYEDVAWLEAEQPIDAQVAMGSLPRFFRRSRSDFPDHRGYLKADPSKVAYWRRRLDALGPGIKVGLSWRGGTRKSRGLLRSIPLQAWSRVLTVPDTHFISLQYTECAEELASLHEQQGITVHQWRKAIDDYDETAALLSALDLTISVCTSVVSLAGALGRPVWVLVPFSPGWIFLREGDSMPWFPSATLFRQQCPREWQEVVTRVAERLSAINRGIP